MISMKRHVLSCDRGSVSLYAVMATFAAIILLGLVVDGGGRVHAEQHASSVAREAARAAGQEIDEATAMGGAGATVNLAGAQHAAQSYLDAADGAAGTAQVANGTVEITATATYEPVMLSIIGIGPMTVHADATARSAETTGGGQEL